MSIWIDHNRCATTAVAEFVAATVLGLATLVPLVCDQWRLGQLRFDRAARNRIGGNTTRHRRVLHCREISTSLTRIVRGTIRILGIARRWCTRVTWFALRVGDAGA